LRREVLLLVGAVWAGSAAASARDYTLIPERFIYCTTCHGVELRGNRALDAPRLNGMDGWYVAAQMRAFATGLRGTHPDDPTGMEMRPQAAALSEADRKAAVDFVTSLPHRREQNDTEVRGDTARGAALYASCAACHGGGAQGQRTLGAPRLAGQSDWYLARQLERYLSGARGYAPADTAGAQMRAAAGVLKSRQDIDDVVAYINSLSTR
jgi:cytochrome c oxidase subunit 2